jgi:hypothetical protein
MKPSRLSRLAARDHIFKLLKGQCHEIFCFKFFHESPSPKPLIITLGSFQIFLKFAEIFASQSAPSVSTTPVVNLPPVSTTPAANLPLVSTTPAANFATSSPCFVDTGGKFATGVNDTSSEYATGVIDTVANNGNNIRLQTPKVNLKAKIYLYISSTTQR